jgi:acetyltransferase-like isoleucine patch superfamily enzyme
MIGKAVQLIKKMQFNRVLRLVEKYASTGNAHYTETFKLLLNAPIADKKYLMVGDNSMVGCQVTFESNQGCVIIGNNSFIGNSQIICRSSIHIEDHVFIAWGCCIYDHNSHSLSYLDRQSDMQQQLSDYRAGRSIVASKNWDVVAAAPIRICSNAWIGMNCLILKGVTIGEGAVVAAGSVVTKDVLPWTVVGGNPARVIKQIPEDISKI